ncbi:MAG: AAA-like domain-containing protein [Lachnospiraceae bacterium]|nr:AAA-like domain-containing protein [Lachnospiraceae bacterium]
MKRYFNITGACNTGYHYMVDLNTRLEKIKQLVDRGNYFTINRARQYGKTTTLCALSDYLKNEYIVIYLDFQRLSYEDFANEKAFVKAFMSALMEEFEADERITKDTGCQLKKFLSGSLLSELFPALSEWCEKSEYPIVLMIDEADSASNYEVFVSFLAQLRAYFNARMTKGKATFQSVILAGVYDIRNLKEKIHINSEVKVEKGAMSPWNIATDFNIDMSFSVEEIAGMLSTYETDHATGMDIADMAAHLFEFTSGYPFLVSKLCKIMDEQIEGTEAWTYKGFLEAVKILLADKNTLFESMVAKLYEYPELKEMVYSLLFHGKEIPYNSLNHVIEIASMFGFIRNDKGIAVIANRIFETVFYNLFLTSTEVQGTDIYKAAVKDKNQFIRDGHLDMERLLEKFVQHFDELYGDSSETFKEEDGRRYFLLYLRPIINGTGNYYIESRTRNMERTDVIVDYHGEQFVVELKIWHGNAYNERGEKQLADYLEHYHLKKGYMLSYNFNKNKEIGVKRVVLGDKVLVEAVV